MAPETVTRFIGPVVILTALGRHFRGLMKEFYGACWLRVASWRYFSGFRVKTNSCSTSLECLFSNWIRFSRKKSCWFRVDRSRDAAVSLLPCHNTMQERWNKLFFWKLRVHIKDNNNSLHGKFHGFLFPFSSKFLDLNLVQYVLYIFSCYKTRMWHKQWAWVTCG